MRFFLDVSNNNLKKEVLFSLSSVAISIYILFLFVIKKKEPLPLRGSTPSTYTVDSPRDAPSLSGEIGVKKGSFWGLFGTPLEGPKGVVF